MLLLASVLLLHATVGESARSSPVVLPQPVVTPKSAPSRAALSAVKLRKLLGSKIFDGVRRCDFNQGPWDEYMRGPLSGTIIFDGNQEGQGVGNVFGGIAQAMQLAIATKRRLVIEYELGGVPLQDVMPLRRGGPDWTGEGLDLDDECSDTFRIFDFAWREAPSVETILSEADDKEGFPILCYSGNFVPTWTAAAIRKRLGVPSGSPDATFGCALNFLFDPWSLADPQLNFVRPAAPAALSQASSRFGARESAPAALSIVGHLRIGDGHLVGEGREIRPILSDARFGLGSVALAADAMLDCMQGLAARYMESRSKRSGGCRITFVSDSSEARRHVLARHARPRGRCVVAVDTSFEVKHTAFHDMEVEQARATVQDLFEIAKSDVALLTGSGFGLSGARMGPVLSGHAFDMNWILGDYSKKGFNVRMRARRGMLRQVCRTQKLKPIT